LNRINRQHPDRVDAELVQARALGFRGCCHGRVTSLLEDSVSHLLVASASFLEAESIARVGCVPRLRDRIRPPCLNSALIAHEVGRPSVDRLRTTRTVFTSWANAASCEKNPTFRVRAQPFDVEGRAGHLNPHRSAGLRGTRGSDVTSGVNGAGGLLS
jgi:hypothetical protein